MTNSDKATTRPWRFMAIDKTKGCIKANGITDTIATVHSNGEWITEKRRDANAELIVRAVNNFDSLLYALKRATAVIAQHHPGCHCCDKDIEIIRQAITKATA